MARRKLTTKDIDRLPSNNIDTPNTPTSEPRLVGKVTTRKKSRMVFEVRNISSYLFEDVILPAIKSAVTDFVTNGIEMVLWGGGGNDRSHSRGGRRNYNRMSVRNRRSHNGPGRRANNRRAKSISVNDIFFDSRTDAELTLGRLVELIAQYEWASVGDLYNLVDISSDHTHERYGWDQLDSARIRHTMDGYIIDLPEPYYTQ